MANEKSIKDVTAFEKDLESNRGLVMHNEDILAALANCPTVDAVEVVHGRWIHRGAWHIECSECNHILAHIGEAKNYCPYCGAKMDGDGNG